MHPISRMLSVDTKFNLLLSCRRFREVESCRELNRIIDDEPKMSSLEWCKISGISSLVVARTKGDAHVFIAQFAEVVKKTPWMIQEILKILPIDLVVESNMKAIKAASKELAKRLPKKAKFRVNLHRRNTDLDRKTLLREVATQFPGKVDLEDYEWICTVEILGPVTGLALLRKEEIITMRRP